MILIIRIAGMNRENNIKRNKINFPGRYQLLHLMQLLQFITFDHCYQMKTMVAHEGNLIKFMMNEA